MERETGAAFRRRFKWFVTGEDPGMRPWRRMAAGIMAIAVLAYVLFWIPLPYYLYGPGPAEELHDKVSVRQGTSPEQGTFMLTTVGVTEANVITYLWGRFNGRDIRLKTNVRQAGETEAEYNLRQASKMTTSQSSAIQAAYYLLSIPYHIADQGILVVKTSKDMPAAAVLKVGDELVDIGGVPIRTGAEIIDYLKMKKAGESVRISFRRGKVLKTADVALAPLPADPGNPEAPPRVGIGFTFANMQSVQADDPAKQVEIRAGDVVGPSAGLMFALETYNQLVEEDITRGYRIAGTGEIDPEGKVGVIGGIEYKVSGADRMKADIFFAPRDAYPNLNTTDALNQAKKIGTDMKVVSVGSLQDALDYLRSLPPKGTSTASGG